MGWWPFSNQATNLSLSVSWHKERVLNRLMGAVFAFLPVVSRAANPQGNRSGGRFQIKPRSFRDPLLVGALLTEGAQGRASLLLRRFHKRQTAQERACSWEHF